MVTFIWSDVGQLATEWSNIITGRLAALLTDNNNSTLVHIKLTCLKMTSKDFVPDTPTLTRHLLATLMHRTDIEGGELVSLLVTIQSIVKNISAAVRRAGISQLFGTQGSVNVQGEEQQKLDILANQVHIHLKKIIAFKTNRIFPRCL